MCVCACVVGAVVVVAGAVAAAVAVESESRALESESLIEHNFQKKKKIERNNCQIRIGYRSQHDPRFISDSEK